MVAQERTAADSDGRRLDGLATDRPAWSRASQNGLGTARRLETVMATRLTEVATRLAVTLKQSRGRQERLTGLQLCGAGTVAASSFSIR